MKRNLLKVAAFLFAAVISVSAMAQTVALQEPIRESADTYEKKGDYQLVNQWIRSTTAGNYTKNDLGGSNLVRGMVTKDGKMYFCFRNNSGGAHSIIVVDGITGAYEKTITLSANAWITESVDAETGEVTMVNAVTLPNNDIKLDSEGNFLVGPLITSANQPMMIYKVDIETGECTELINEVITENPEYAELSIRFDAFGVWGDVEDYAVVMAMNANAMNAFRWVIEDGVAGAAELVTLDPLFEGDPSVNPGTAPQIRPISEDLFYVDGNATFPTLYQYADGKGTRIDCFYDAEGNALPILSTMNQGHNGITDFQLTNAEGETEYFICCAATNTVKDPISSFAIIKYADESLSFQTAELIYQFPKNGFGGQSNAYRTAPVSVEVIDNVAHLYCYAGENGFGHYTFSCDNEDVDVDVYFNINLSCNSDQGTVVGCGQYAKGKNVTIKAIPNDGYHFVKWSDGNTNATRTITVRSDITLTAEFEIDDNRILISLEEPVQESADTYEKKGDYQLVNQWIRSTTAGNYTKNDLGGSGLVRGMVTKDGKMYFCFRNNSGGAHSIIVVDGITGAYEKTITLSANAWITESVDAETGEVTMVNAVTLPNNDIKLDSEGNFLVGPLITSGTQPMMIYKVDIETGECTELINEVIANNPEYADLNVRFDAFGVWGDVEDYAVVMAMNTNAMNAFRWVIEDGVAGAAELVTLDPLFEGDPSVNPGSAPQIRPISEDLFYVDGNATFPTLYQYADGKGTRIDCFYDAEGNALPILSTMNQGHNGITDFKLLNAAGETEYFMCCAATNTVKDPISSFAIIKYADESLSFQTAELIYQFPKNGFGGQSNAYRAAPVSVEVIDNVAHLYCYVGENGFGHYTFSCDNEDVDVDVYFNINLSCNSDQGTVVGSGQYAKGKNVTIKAIANEGYHFVRWSDGNTNATRTITVTGDITLTAEFEINDNSVVALQDPITEPIDTYEKKGDYQLVNQWIRSTTAGNYTKNDLGGSNLVRGMVAKDGKMYFCYRGGIGTHSIIVVDGVTGAYEKTIILSENAFTKVENEGTDSANTVSAVLLPNNDIKLDSEGNFLVGPCITSGAQPMMVYKVDIETGECTELINEVIAENPEYAELSIRFDAFGVWGDVEDYAVVMAMNANAMNAFRWVIEDGVAGAAELVTLDPLHEGDPSVTPGSAPQIRPISEDLFYVDGNATFPTLYQYADGKGTRIDCFYDAEGNALPILSTMNQGHNGIIDFKLTNAEGETEYFMCCAATNTVKDPISSFAIIKYADESLSFQTAELIYQFPKNGFGGTSNAYRTAPVSVEVIDNVAHLYCYVGENGFGHYTFSCDNEDVDNDTTPEPIKYIEYVNICHGDIYYFGGQYISETGIYQHIFAASNGCDSIVELHLTVLPDYKQTFDVTIREGETYNGHGFVGLTEQGTYSLHLVSVDGCDSTIILNLTVERIIVVDSIYYRKVSESEVSVIAPENDLYRGNIVIPESITYMGTAYSVIGIDQYTFANMPITSLTIEPNICPEYGNIIEGCEQLEVLKVGTCLLYNLDTYNEYYAFPSLRELHIIGGYVEYLPDYWDLEVVDLSKADNIDLYANFFVNTNYMYAWDNLKRLVLPENLEVIYPRQFEGLWLLEEIVIPENVTEIPDGAFYNCHALSSVTLSKNLLSIGNYAFYNCHAIKNLVVPEGVTEIGNSAFYGCTYLEEIELPTTLTEINDNAFALCSKVKSIKSKALVPPMLSVKTFYEIDRNIPIYVAEKAYYKYVNDQYWSEFFNIIAVPEYSGGETTLIEDTNTESFVVYTQGGMLHIEGVDTDYNIFDSTGKLIYTGNSSQLQLSQGVYIIVAGNKVQKVVL